jgi:uncharacterized membrane protein
MSVAGKPGQKRGRAGAQVASTQVVAAPSRPQAASAAPIAAILPLVFAVIGLGLSAYLTFVHYAKAPLTCSTGKTTFFGITINVNCGQVTSSAYSVVGNTSIPITAPGMAWFVVSGGMAALALIAFRQGRSAPKWLATTQLAWGTVGLVFVLYLIYVEAAKLHEFCEWCSVVHLLVILTFLVALFHWQRAMAARYAQ